MSAASMSPPPSSWTTTWHAGSRFTAPGRGGRWRTVEAPIDLAGAIRRESAPRVCLLVDCLTVWLGNLAHHGHDVDAAREALLDALAAAPGPVVLVANEVGLGIVPDNAMARAFRDHAGRLNQAVAGRRRACISSPPAYR